MSSKIDQTLEDAFYEYENLCREFGITQVLTIEDIRKSTKIHRRALLIVNGFDPTKDVIQ